MLRVITAAGLTGEDRPDLDPLDTRSLDRHRDLVGDLLTDLYQLLTAGGIEDLLLTDTADDPVAQRLEDVATFTDRADVDAVGAHLYRVQPLSTVCVSPWRPAGLRVKVPAMPRAAQPALTIGADFDRAFAKRTALVRAAVEEPDEVAVEIEDDDLPPLDGDELAGARRNFIDLCDDVTGHAQTP